jgi:hypothetical protein
VECSTAGGTRLEGGIIYPEVAFPASDCWRLNTFQKYYQPGGVYKLTASVRKEENNAENWLDLGIHAGNQVLYGPRETITTDFEDYSVYVQLGGTAWQAHAFLGCVGCNLEKYTVAAVITRFRATSKTLTDQVRNQSYTFTYSYSGGATNDGDHSYYVYQNWCNPETFHLFTKAFSEFRGHEMVIETGPDGSVRRTYYYQDDIFKGQVYQSQVETSEGDVLSASATTYTSQEQPTGTLPHPENQGAGYYDDLKILWVYPTADASYSYEGDSSYVGWQAQYYYGTGDQGGDAVWEPHADDRVPIEWDELEHLPGDEGAVLPGSDEWDATACGIPGGAAGAGQPVQVQRQPVHIHRQQHDRLDLVPV